MIRVVQCRDEGIGDGFRLCEMLRKYGARASYNLTFSDESLLRTPRGPQREA